MVLSEVLHFTGLLKKSNGSKCRSFILIQCFWLVLSWTKPAQIEIDTCSLLLFNGKPGSLCHPKRVLKEEAVKTGTISDGEHAKMHSHTQTNREGPSLKVQLHPTATVELLFGVKFLHKSVGAGRHLTTITMVTELGKV